MNNIIYSAIAAVIATAFSLIAFVRTENKRKHPFPRDKFDDKMRILYKEELPLDRREKHDFCLAYRNISKAEIGFLCSKCEQKFTVNPSSLFDMNECKELLLKQSEFCKHEKPLLTFPNHK